ncbi:hypothetical protein B9Q13_04930 [Candidatus Marsarchaeota G2 archaeon ECH_B_SAG-G16]|uniref:ArnR1-like winged helix-turn-helix domain-containing protein n=6 Tax=Candidatus Marsarchaeota TaxID=1978152 RepID=A0A2R6C0M9_9ARCH|nr:MAG: hypothetical protein B9Q01_03435 [Candidatus Marsarchaeota G1 archaeon OSP_D]PSN84004.1 MAG: hypothetical protein B9Q02_09960 [Candidatus Marsarchaeota G1 archaeon BE_D]PSN87281.1 MAG: hypothetical protein B9P99_06675 [Candidatus Marsarchaeota G1 archaeon OSP_B]PSN87945.1 MAG: hypothetical protein B9Q00_07245 [Candidatus Marsarchaeota G1 archaeon OSP_C]PSO04307.1 MAG: hypothetical protein B9Q13_04930 [Candidatus Marsarchaeota G2 archaeon ECH_B_SAG-G16]PSO04438.1 MAG: hypothetical prote
MPKRKYRTKVKILYDILSSAITPVKKTRIMSMSNLNPHTFKFYFEFCLGNGLLSEKEGYYELTEKGHRFLNDCKSILDRIEEIERIGSRSGLIVDITVKPVKVLEKTFSNKNENKTIRR